MTTTDLCVLKDNVEAKLKSINEASSTDVSFAIIGYQILKVKTFFNDTRIAHNSSRNPDESKRGHLW